ncbi:hypothetical protein H2202_002549 [Exophiala xenobiotica]|nr:hypothetical protein H2202_002549 [Exophiala xenobiotica]KAK5205109.1 hypothetical protein LTR41_009320 [Exophiala xenobiotica]KAK5420014.1 hypothetical protein LTR06_001484 [Exophiala xenobiotica]
MDLMRLDTPTLLAGIRDFDFHRRHEQSESESESRSESSLMGLPIEIRLKIYGHCVDDRPGETDKLLTIELSPQPYAFSANGNNVILQVKDVDPGIAALFGVCRQLRREVKDFFWRYYRLRIRPVSMVLTRFDGIETTFRQLRKVLLEVVHPVPLHIFRYTFDVTYLLKSMPWFLQLPLLEDMDVLIDFWSLLQLIPSTTVPREIGHCPRHMEYIRASPVFRQLHNSLEKNCFLEGLHLEFRFHMTQRSLLRMHDSVTRKRPSLGAIGNNSLAPCHNHTLLGSCELITCRMLHAIEEDSTHDELTKNMRYRFLKEKFYWGPNTTLWTGKEHEMPPRVISLVDLKEGMSINTPRPTVEAEDMFDMFYSWRTAPAQAGTLSTEGKESKGEEAEGEESKGEEADWEEAEWDETEGEESEGEEAKGEESEGEDSEGDGSHRDGAVQHFRALAPTGY